MGAVLDRSGRGHGRGSVVARSSTVLATALAVLLAAACRSAPPPPDDSKIRIGMRQDEVAARYGRPAETRGPVPDPGGRLQETWLYEVETDVETGRDVTAGVLSSGVGFFRDPTRGNRLEFVFVDGRLVRWGQEQAAPARPAR